MHIHFDYFVEVSVCGVFGFESHAINSFHEAMRKMEEATVEGGISRVNSFYGVHGSFLKIKGYIFLRVLLHLSCSRLLGGV